MGDRELRRRCEALLNDLELPQPFDVEALCTLLGQRRRRPIHLFAVPLPPGTPCGLWVSTTTYDAIFYEQNTSPLHQAHIIGHELGHLLCGHYAAPIIDAEASRLLMPDLDPGLVQRILGRSNYTAIEEREAEMIASLISRAATRPAQPSSAVDPAAAPLLGRLQHTLEDSDWSRLGG